MAWLAPPSDKDGVAGQAFRIGDWVALTCAHVVRDHLGLGTVSSAARPVGELRLNFGGLRREVGARVAHAAGFPRTRARI